MTPSAETDRPDDRHTTGSRESQIRDSIVYLIPLMVGSLVPMATLPVFTRFLTREDYGALALVQIFAIFASGLANLGLVNAYNRNYFQHTEREAAGGLLFSTLAFVGSVHALVAVPTFVFKGFIAAGIAGSPDHGALLFASFCANGLVSIKSFFLAYYRNSEEAIRYARVFISEICINVSLSMLFVVGLKTGVIGLVYGQLLANAVLVIILLRRFARVLPVAWSWPILRDAMRIGAPLTPRVFFGVIGSQFDKYMIGQLVSSGGVGIYSIGQKVAYLVFMYMTAIQNVFSPQVFRKMFATEENNGAVIGRYLTPFAYVSVVVALGIALFSEEIIIVLTPAPFHGAIDIVTVLCLFYGVMFFGKQPQLLYAGKTFISSAMTFVSIALNVALNIPFIMKWGAIGAAWATLLAGLVSGWIHYGVSQHHYRIQWELRKVGAIYGIFFAAALVAMLMRHYGQPYALRLSVKLMFLVGYIALGARLGVLTRENLRMVRSMVPLGRRHPA